MKMLGKSIINKEILPYLSIKKRGKIYREAGLWRVVESIIYKLKTGTQWRFLPLAEFFPDYKPSWQSIYYYYYKWSSSGDWEDLWQSVLSKYKEDLGLSSIDLDGSHTLAKNGGEAVGYQGRKR